MRYPYGTRDQWPVSSPLNESAEWRQSITAPTTQSHLDSQGEPTPEAFQYANTRSAFGSRFTREKWSSDQWAEKLSRSRWGGDGGGAAVRRGAASRTLLLRGVRGRPGGRDRLNNWREQNGVRLLEKPTRKFRSDITDFPLHSNFFPTQFKREKSNSKTKNTVIWNTRKKIIRLEPPSFLWETESAYGARKRPLKSLKIAVFG